MSLVLFWSAGEINDLSWINFWSSATVLLVFKPSRETPPPPRVLKTMPLGYKSLQQVKFANLERSRSGNVSSMLIYTPPNQIGSVFDFQALRIQPTTPLWPPCQCGIEPE
jgi:hypothetical protein